MPESSFAQRKICLNGLDSRFFAALKMTSLQLAFAPVLEPRADLQAHPARVHSHFARQELVVRLDKVVLAELQTGKDLSPDAGRAAGNRHGRTRILDVRMVNSHARPDVGRNSRTVRRA